MHYNLRMRILLALLAGLGVAALWWWRIKMVGEAASEIHDLAGRAYGKYKRNKFRQKVEESPLESVNDPAAAAVIMMYAMAQEAGPLAPQAEEAVAREVRQTMKIHDSDELLVFGKWVASHVTDASNVTHRYAKLWQAHLNPAERQDLVEMVRRVALSQGSLSLRQKLVLSKLGERLGIQS